MATILVCAVVLTALVFTYTNGFHDTANSIATVIGTRVLTPGQAVVLAAGTNLVGSFFGLAVAKTISNGLVEGRYVSQEVLVCTLVAAIAWNLLTWWLGLPSSSSHALVGSLCGATLAAAHGNWSAIKWTELKPRTAEVLVEPTRQVLAAIGTTPLADGTTTLVVGADTVRVVAFAGRMQMVAGTAVPERAGLLYKVVLPMVTSPLLGFACGLVVMSLLYLLLAQWRPTAVSRLFGRLQLGSSAYMGVSHGMNDATKCMGLVTLALVSATSGGLLDRLPGFLAFLKTPAGADPHRLTLVDTVVSWLPVWLQFGYMPTPIHPGSQAIPDWVVVLCALTMAAGTAAGGWRIIGTLGHRLVKLQAVHGFAAETTAATLLAVTAHFGMPVSTTHTISTSIMGVGCARRFSALKLRLVQQILWAWVLTIPATLALAFGMVWVLQRWGWIG